jgi:hypothetical protein
MSDALLTAERDGLASMLLDVQRECAELQTVLRECQRTLAMIVEPQSVRQTSVAGAYAACVAAEAKARRILGDAQ